MVLPVRRPTCAGPGEEIGYPSNAALRPCRHAWHGTCEGGWMQLRIRLIVGVASLTLAACQKVSTDLTGTVIGPDGEPIAGARVALHDFEFPDGQRDVTTTDAAGRFEVGFEDPCGFSMCPLEGGTARVSAAGHLTAARRFDGLDDQPVTVRLWSDDGLDVGQSGIPSETPLWSVTRTTVWRHEVSRPGPDQLRPSGDIVPVDGICIEAVDTFGRRDMYRCDTTLGKRLDPCFLVPGDDVRDVLFCSDGYGVDERSRWLLTASAPLPPAPVPDPTIHYPPLRVTLATDGRLRWDGANCHHLSEPLALASGERLAYECDGTPRTWLLPEFDRGEVWTVTRVGTLELPSGGVVQEAARRTVELERVVR